MEGFNRGVVSFPGVLREQRRPGYVLEAVMLMLARGLVPPTGFSAAQSGFPRARSAARDAVGLFLVCACGSGNAPSSSRSSAPPLPVALTEF